MSSKYSRLLITTCFSVITLSLYTAIPANAGFDWTPPEEAPAAAPENEIQMPKGSALPVMPPVVVEEEEILGAPPKKMATAPAKVPAVEKPIKSETPVLKTKVIDAPPKQPVPKTAQNQPIKQKTFTPRKNVVPAPLPTEQPPVAQQDKTPVTASVSKPSVEQPQGSSVPRRKKPKMPKQAAAPSKVTAPNMLPPPIAENKPVEITPPVQQQKSGGLKINPYPKNTGKQAAGNPVVLKDEDPQDAGERALQSVYSGDKSSKKEEITWKDEAPSKFSVVEGFGTDMPLALALGQIVPPSYAYSFGDGVNPGQKVSWSGGKPWNDILSEVLAPLGISFELNGQKLVMMKADETSLSQNTQGSDDQLKKKQN